MAKNIQRLRYFDGEYLRSNDFTDEQSYHVAMRRRLNQQLHFSGIVSGLAISQDANSVPPNLLFFSVASGVAIDQVGREIVVTAPYVLSGDNVLGRAGLQAGDNELWIVYTETATGLPAAGYELCNDAGQNTRWTESFDVMLKPRGALPSKVAPDPDADLKGIRLGTVTLQHDSVRGWYISGFDNLGRTYVGIRAQSIVAPDEVDTDSFSFTAQNVVPPTGGSPALAPPGYLDIVPGTFVRGNLIAQMNLVLGDDYALQNLSPPGPPPTLTNATGNLKLNSDLFLKGDVYKTVNGNWLGLASYIQSLMPDFQMAPIAITIPVNTQNGTSTPVTTFTTKLPQPWHVDAQACLSRLKLETSANVEGGLTSGQNFDWAIEVKANVSNQTAQSVDVAIDWALGTGWLNGPNTIFLFKEISVVAIVVFRPGP
jgi:hypothetical protein